MANTLTGLIPIIYEALDIVSREQVGFIPSISIDASAETAAVGQTVRIPLAGVSTASDIVAANVVPNTGTQTVNYADMTISKSRGVPIQWTGEEQRAVGAQYETIVRNQFAQAFRALTNEVETDLSVAATLGASRAVGTAGTTPFGTAGDLSDFANVNQVLDDNGAPQSMDRHLVTNSAAKAKLSGKQSVLFKVNEAGDSELLRNGVIGQVEGLNIHTSTMLGRNPHTAGTGTSYVLNGASNVGDTSIALKTGSGTILAGDILTFGSDVNKYVVNTGITAPGSVIIAAPGNLTAETTGATATVSGSYTPNFAFTKNAIQLIARAPLMPMSGDAAADVAIVTDPVSGLSFQIAVYNVYRQVHIEVALAWGVSVIKPEHLVTLLG